ncbi:hypothetical protein BDW59DRAFT_150112 [Aspergillus cavernicola]|uniref:Uncharacterized protein n=1 Tax=Aspergillus cavernicola TaxID=176166 RepID=A0ABR4I120_9EURO
MDVFLSDRRRLEADLVVGEFSLFALYCTPSIMLMPVIGAGGIKSITRPYRISSGL